MAKNVSNFDKRWSDAHFLSFLNHYNCTLTTSYTSKYLYVVVAHAGSFYNFTSDFVIINSNMQYSEPERKML